jgi:hypothetical protein
MHGWKCGECGAVSNYTGPGAWEEAEEGLKTHLRLTNHKSLGSERYGDYAENAIKTQIHPSLEVSNLYIA